MIRPIYLCLGLLLAASFAAPSVTPARADAQRVLVTVDDQPITDYDVEQRTKLYEALDMRRPTETKAVVKELVDDEVIKSEAKRNKINVGDKQIDESIARLAKGSNTTVDGLSAKLKEKGVVLSTLKDFVASQILTRWLMSKDGAQPNIEVDQAAVDRKMAEIENDPRMKPIELYQIVQIELPVEKSGNGIDQQLLYARAVEAQQLSQRYKGCGSLRSASEGIFNVKIGQPMQAVAEKMPPEMKKALDEAGTKRLIGPIPGPTGIRMIANCGRKQMAPPKPSREQIESMLLSEKMGNSIERELRDLRRKSFIDYKDASLK
ncbi:MAG: SurA N-terminal domain-containing protein [Hyphomicrobiales bacterium]